MAGNVINLVVLSLFAVTLTWQVARGADATLASECSEDFQKVVGCIGFATGKASTPTKECCGSVTEMRAESPKCMCFIIEQSKNGSQQIKALGIQTAKLLQLPAACQLKNTSVSDCPKLLGLAANSPEAEIFSGDTSSPTTSTKATPTSTPASSSTSGSDDRKLHFTATGLLAVVLTLVTAVASYHTS